MTLSDDFPRVNYYICEVIRWSKVYNPENGAIIDSESRFCWEWVLDVELSEWMVRFYDGCG